MLIHLPFLIVKGLFRDLYACMFTGGLMQPKVCDAYITVQVQRR